MPLPTLVIVPTSFAVSSLYDGQLNFLRERGYAAHALDPPTFAASYKPDTAAPSMSDDAQFIKSFVTKLADEGNDVVILAHSYGAVPASQCLQGLTARERKAKGKRGGVVRMAYVTGVVPKLGESTIAAVTASATGAVPAVTTDEFGWMIQNDPEKTALKVFNSLSPEQGKALSKSFGRHAAPAFIQPLAYAGYSKLPVSWYFCEDDLSVVPEVQQNGIDAIEQSWNGTERAGRKADITRNKCDHMPLFSATNHFNLWIESVILKGDHED